MPCIPQFLYSASDLSVFPVSDPRTVQNRETTGQSATRIFPRLSMPLCQVPMIVYPPNYIMISPCFTSPSSPDPRTRQISDTTEVDCYER